MWYLKSTRNGLKQGPFKSVVEAAEHRAKMPCPVEWSFVKETENDN